MTTEIHVCEHQGCQCTETIKCHLVDYKDFKGEPEDIYNYYCAEHCKEEGFCYGCGEFWAGCEEFDFSSSGLCGNCLSELKSELGEDEDCMPYWEESGYYR